MVVTNYYWKETNEKFEKILKLIKSIDTEVVSLGIILQEKLLKDKPFYFGRIADYITIEYGYQNTFSWSDWSPIVWEKLHEQCHDFLNQAPIDSSICKYASHKSALRFLGFFNKKGDLQFLTNYLKSSNYKTIEKELQEFFLWTLSKVLQHNVDSPNQELIDWIIANIDKDWFLAYRIKIAGYIGHYSKAVLNWVINNFASMNKTEQEEIITGAMAVESATSFYETIFEKIPEYVAQQEIKKERNSYYKLYHLHKNSSHYISNLEELQPYPAEKELLSLPTIHTDYYLKKEKERLFRLILLNSTIAVQAKIGLFIKMMKHRKNYTFFISPSTQEQFIKFIHNKLKESQELILPEEYEIEEGLEKIEKLKSKAENPTNEKWHEQWVVN